MEGLWSDNVQQRSSVFLHTLYNNFIACWVVSGCKSTDCKRVERDLEHLLVQGSPTCGLHPLVGCERTATGPQKRSTSMRTSPLVWTGGECMHSNCMSGRPVYTLLAQMELYTCIHTCQPLAWNHHLSSPPSCQSAEPEMLSVLV